MNTTNIWTDADKKNKPLKILTGFKKISNFFKLDVRKFSVTEGKQCVGAGGQRFVLIREVESSTYLVNDTIYIKIEVKSPEYSDKNF